MRVIRRVSTPVMAAMPRLSSQASRCWLLRQLDGSVIGARATMPRAYGCQRLDILVVDADIADVRKGEGDDLAGVGRIG